MADVKISALPAASSIDGADTVVIVQGGTTKKAAKSLDPISVLQQAALDLKAPIASPTFTGTVGGVTKAMVGLGSVDNTADTAKPVSTAQQTALDLKAPLLAPVFGAGSATAGTKPKLTSGTLLTAPEAGAIEYDGASYYLTGNTTSGREQALTQAHYLMTGDGNVSNTAAITDMFPANSSFATVTNGIYEVIAEIYYLKTTNGTMVYTLTNTQNYTHATGTFMQTAAATGIGGGGSTFGGAVAVTGAAVIALSATASLTGAINHYARLRFLVECATAGNIRIRGTPSAGTFTMLRGSWYTVRRLGSAIVGSFVA